jgi:hypothetical protein
MVTQQKAETNKVATHEGILTVHRQPPTNMP